MVRPTGDAVADRAIMAVKEGHTYAQMDCQALIEHCVNQCGGAMAYAGSNDMARNAIAGLWPLADAQKKGRLLRGAALFIHAGFGSEPAKYRADGLGDFNHVGYYVGQGALTDADKNGKNRVCNCVHSSQSMGRVAGSTIKNGWTHVGWFRAVDYGVAEGDSGMDAVQSEAAQAAMGQESSALEQEPAAQETAASAQTPAAHVAGFYRVKRGCKGGAVRRLQTWLLDLGYDVGTWGADGDFGQRTHAAVCAFQAISGLEADGMVGQNTWLALAEARSTAMQEVPQG